MFRSPCAGGARISIRKCLAVAAWTTLAASASSPAAAQTAEPAPREGTASPGDKPESAETPPADAVPVETQPEALPRGATPGERSGDDQGLMSAAGPAPAALRRTRRWEAQVGVGERWDTNPEYAGGDDVQGSWVTGANASLSRDVLTRHGAIDLSAAAALIRYSEATRLNATTYEGHVSGSQAASPRTDLGFDAGVSRSYTGETRSLTDSGLLLPQSLVDRQSVALSIAQHLSPRTSITVRGRYQHLTFPSEDTSLQGGSQADAGAGYTRRLGANESLGLGISYQSNASETENTGAVYGATAAWNGRLGARALASASLGIASFAHQGSEGRSTRPVGSAAVTQKAREWSGTLEYDRQTGQIFGTGRDGLTDVLGFRVARTISKDADFSVNYQHGWTRDPSDDRFATQSDNVGASFAMRVARSLAVAVTYSYLYNTAGDPIAADQQQSRHQAQLSLVHVNRW